MSDQAATPNHRLAAVMRAADISNKRMASKLRRLSERDGGEVVRPDHGQVGRWLDGSIRQPSTRRCLLIARVLSEELGRAVSLEEIGYPDVPTDVQEVGATYPVNLAASIDALAQLAQNELRERASALDLVVVPDQWSTLLLRWFMDGDTEPQTEATWRPVGVWDVEAVRDARTMFANYDYKFGGGRPKPLVTKFLDSEVIPRLPHVSPHSPVGREYFREAAALARLAGWTAYDTGAHGLAQRYLMQAFRLARAAGDRALCGRILAGMSHQANFLGHHQKAVDLARAAHQRATGAATPTAMALFFAMEARAHASLGDGVAVRAALASAESWHSKSDPTNDPDWITFFDAAELHAEFAHCFRDLGESRLATDHAAASIAASQSIYVRSLSFCRTVLATGHLLGSDLEQALSIATGVVDTAAQLRSARVTSYLDDFKVRIRAAHGDDPRVRQFEAYAAQALVSLCQPDQVLAIMRV